MLFGCIALIDSWISCYILEQRRSICMSEVTSTQNYSNFQSEQQYTQFLSKSLKFSIKTEII